MQPLYTRAPAAAAIAARLMRTCPEFSHLDGAHLGYVLSEPVLKLRGAVALGMVIVPTYIQGPLRECYLHLLEELLETPDDLPGVLMLLHGPTWRDHLDDVGREHLVYHELSHLQQRENAKGEPMFDQAGRPLLRITPHDHERFTQEIARYGAERTRLTPALQAAADYDARRRGPRRIA